VTSGHHLLPSGSSQSAFEQLAKENNLFSVSDTGVSPEEEMIQISGNASKIQFLMNIYKKQRNLFKIALGKNEG
jgi:flagellar basal body rod protein FlgB